MSTTPANEKPAGQHSLASTGEDKASSFDQHQQGSSVSYTAAEEKALVRKIDLILLPSLSILYLLSFLDRSNIANARIAGLATDLSLTSSEYSVALTLFFVGYVLFELPANWGLKATNPPFWMPFLTISFGIVSLTQGLVTNRDGLWAIRFFLGIAEAGLFPGTVFIFSHWYQRKERVVRVSLFFAGAAAAGAFGGILAYAIGRMEGVGGKRGWEWIFILEGILTVVIGAITFFTIPNYPTKTKWFTSREIEILHHRLAIDSDALETEEGGINWSGVRQALTDYRVYLFCALFHGMSFALYTISFFLPTIIAELGYATWQAQLLTTPPYVLAFIVVMTVAWSSKRVGYRTPFILSSIFVALIGYIVLITAPNVAGRYIATFIIVSGVYSANALLLAWPSENLAGATKRNTALAMVISLGNCGAIIGTQVYRIPLGGVANVGYHVSFGLTIVWLFFAFAACSTLFLVMRRENNKRAALLSARQSDGWTETRSEEEISKEWQELGDHRVEWKYQL